MGVVISRGGITDHGGLSGLSDDDHNYLLGGFTLKDDFTYGVEFVATNPGIAVISGDITSGEDVRILIDKENAGTDIKTYKTDMASAVSMTGFACAPFNSGDGVTLAHTTAENLQARVYYFV